MTGPAQAAVQRLQGEGYAVNFLRLRQIAPMDWPALDAVEGDLMVVEDCVAVGCVGEAVAAHFSGSGKRIICCNHGAKFVTHGAISELNRSLGMDADGLVRR